MTDAAPALLTLREACARLAAYKSPHQLFNSAETSAFLGVSNEQLRSMVDRGEIPYVNVSMSSRRLLRFRLDDIWRKLHEGAPEPKTASAQFRSERARLAGEANAAKHYFTAPRPRVERIEEPHVYVIGFDKFVKIGFTAVSTESRIKAMQTAVPMPLKVYAQFACPFGTEEKLHERFAIYRTNGEWFLKRGDLAEWIKGGCSLDGIE